jgi:hypothetical protein
LFASISLRIPWELGTIAQDQGEYEEAHRLYQQSLAMFERLEDQSGQAGSLHQLGVIVQDQGEYEEARSLYQQSLIIFRQLGDQNGQAGSLHQLGRIAQGQGEYEEAHNLYQQSLVIKERLRNRSGQAISLGQLGLLAYEQKDFENALAYMIQAYILFDALRSPFRALAQRTITEIRSHMDEETFMTHWRTLTGDRPLVTVVEQEDTVDTDEDDALTVEELPSIVSSIILRGTAEQHQQIAADLIEAQQQLPPEAAPLRQFLECLVAALRGETPEVALLEPPFTELWQKFQERLRMLLDQSSQQEEEQHE